MQRLGPMLFSGLLLFAGCGSPHTRSTAHATGEIPVIDNYTRAKAAKLNVNEIKEFRFTGVQFIRFDNDPIVVKDKEEMGRYITALRHSYSRHQPVSNGIDILEVVFLPHKGEEVPSQRFYFNLSNDLDCFGPEFRKEALALQARIATKDKAAQAAHKSTP